MSFIIELGIVYYMYIAQTPYDRRPFPARIRSEARIRDHGIE